MIPTTKSSLTLAGFREGLIPNAISGFIVFLIALPLCLGIAMASDFPPFGGLITAIIGGLIVSLFAGSELTIKGPAAGLIAIAAISVETLGNGNAQSGYQLTLAVIVVASLIQIVFGLLKAGVLGDFFPSASVHGMMAAIGIIIISKQIHPLMGVKAVSKEPFDLLAEIPHSISIHNPEIAIIGGISMAILILLPLINHPIIKKIPAQMIVILVAIPLGHYFNLEQEHNYFFSPAQHTYSIGPKFLVSLPDNFIKGITFPDFSQIMSLTSIQYIVMFAMVGSLESMLTVKAIDLIDPQKRKADPNRDLLAVGIGNTLCGLLGGLPMIAEVVRSSANVNNGAKNRWANWFHGLFLLIFLVFLPWLIVQIPLSALAAMLVYTGYKLASPHHFISTLKIGKDQLIIFVVTIIVTLWTDLLLGIGAGLVVKLIMHLLSGASLSTLFRADIRIESYDNIHTVYIKRAAVFSNFMNFKSIVNSLPPSERVIIDFSETRLMDHSFITQLISLQKTWEKRNKILEFKGMEQLKPVSDHPMASRKLEVAI
ncbi:MAG TPA: SulP family inorganic anion transporter [Catalimonadaceae bacterium]|nr:SulP family inorganic anion transporter [Catalimonadaceae bacterium]